MSYQVAGALLVVLGLAGCGGGSSTQIDPNRELVGNRWNATLAPTKQLAGAVEVKGAGWMAAKDREAGETRASVQIENAVPGGEHPWHVHVGQCGMDRGIFGPPSAYKPLKVGGNGRAESTADLPLAMPRSGQYFLNVHASAANMGTILACGNLAPPSR